MIEFGKPLVAATFSFTSILGGNVIHVAGDTSAPSAAVVAMVRELCERQRCQVSETPNGSVFNVHGDKSVDGDRVEYFGYSPKSTKAEKTRSTSFELSLMVSKPNNDPLYSVYYYSNGGHSSANVSYVNKKQTKGDVFTMEDLTVMGQTTFSTGYNYMSVSPSPHSAEGVSNERGIVEQTDPKAATKELGSIDAFSEQLVSDIHNGRHLPFLGQVIRLAEVK